MYKACSAISSEEKYDMAGRFVIPIFFHRNIKYIDKYVQRCGLCLYRESNRSPDIYWFVSTHTQDYKTQKNIEIYSIPKELQTQLMDWKIETSAKNGDCIFHGSQNYLANLHYEEVRGKLTFSFDPNIPTTLGSKLNIDSSRSPKLLILSIP